MSSSFDDMLRTWWSSLARRMRRLRRRPLLATLGNLVRSGPFRPLDINCMYLLEYVGIPPRHASLLRGPAEVRGATLQDLEALTRCQNRPRAFLNRFRSNDHCAVAVANGRIVAYQWFCARPVYTEERYAYRIEIPPDAIYAYDVFILPEYRMAGIWLKFHCLYLKELMERLGRRRIIGMVDYGNRLAMNTHLRFGFKIFHRVVVIRALGKSIFVERPHPGDKAALPRWISVADGGGDPYSARPGRAHPPGPGSRLRKEPTVDTVDTTDAAKVG